MAINTPEACDIIISLGPKIVEIKHVGFEDNIFTMYLKFLVPNVIKKSGFKTEIRSYYVPIGNDKFRKENIEEFIFSMGTDIYSGDFCKTNKNIGYCSKHLGMTKFELSKKYEKTYDIIEQKNCIINTEKNFVTISSNYEVNIQKLNTPIEHSKISPGFHRIPRENFTVIFACFGYAHLVIPDLEYKEYEYDGFNETIFIPRVKEWKPKFWESTKNELLGKIIEILIILIIFVCATICLVVKIKKTYTNRQSMSKCPSCEDISSNTE